MSVPNATNDPNEPDLDDSNHKITLHLATSSLSSKIALHSRLNRARNRDRRQAMRLDIARNAVVLLALITMDRND